MRLRQVTWSPSWVAAASAWSSCTLGPTGATGTVSTYNADVPIGQDLICTGSFNMTQDVMEEGAAKQLTATVAVKVTDALQALALPGGSVTAVTVPVTVNPQLVIDVLETDCIKPFRAGKKAGTRLCVCVCGRSSPQWGPGRGSS